jgi:regulator of protease activity HflC (stomatin/prohibitin superfamily)
MLLWYVPAPDEALLITGSKHQGTDIGFRVVTGRGSFVWPIRQKARILSLALREAQIVEDCVTSQGIHLNVRSVAAFKIGNDPVSIADAARRFLSAQDRIEEIVGPLLAGHVRSVIGGVTVEHVITRRDQVTAAIKKSCRADMDHLGIVVDALEIQEIEDASGYIANLAAPHAAAVASQARIAKANADLEASERECQVAELKAQYERDLEIKRASFGLEVAEQQMALAQREAEVAAVRLDAEVRQAADAEAYRRRTVAEADRDQAKFAADAEAYRMLTIARAQTQTAKVNGQPLPSAVDQDRSRRVRLRQPAARRG